MKLYTAQIAPSARRVAMYLAEKGIEVPTVEVDFANGEQLTDDFKQINPQCMVPCLELDNGTIITESIAICRYFEKLQPAPVLFGSTAEEIASIEMWGRFCELNGFLVVAEFLRNSFDLFKDRGLPGPVDYEQIPALVERAKRRYAYFIDTLDARLAQSDFVAGNAFSNTDITAFITIEAGNMFQLPWDEAKNSIARWYKAVAKRQSAHA